jgi:diguanylate cyclase (GGDEF)-like protein
MEVMEEGPGLLGDELRARYNDTERRLRILELEKIDLVQSVRQVFKSMALLLTRRGFNNDLAAQLTQLDNRLGSEADCLGVFDQAASGISGLSGQGDQSIDLGLDQGADLARESDGALLRDAIDNLLTQLTGFRNDRYQHLSHTIRQLIDRNSSLESLLPVLIDLCLRFLADYGQEIGNITNRLNSIIRMLLFTEQEYYRFLDSSIANYDQGERSFKKDLAEGLEEIQKSVLETTLGADAVGLLNHVSHRIEGLLWAIQRKGEEDARLLLALSQEKELLASRLDKVRRDYDTFVSQSHKTLIELETIKSISLRDPLTKVYNRRAFDEQMAITVDNFEKGKLSTFGLIIFDIDLFREVNNSYGHLAGDSILSHVGRLIKECLRCDDFIFRYGGDEFIVLLPEARLPDTVKVAEKLRHQVEVVEFRLSRSSSLSIHITISVGVTESSAGDTSTSVLARADRALYISKQGGRNRVSSL